MSALGVLRRGSAFVALGSALLACTVADGESPAAPLEAGLSVEGSTTTLSASATTAAEEDRLVETDRAVEVVGVESTPPDPRPDETSSTSVSVSESSPPTSDRVSASTSIPTPDRVPASTSIPTPESDAGLLGALTVVAEGSRAGYDRTLFSHWRDTNGSGCDARQDTLAEQVIGFPQVDLFDSCVIVEGDWYSIFDGVTHAGSPSELDIDHVIALAEAWDSGASTWDSATRRRFANDPAHLVAVTASSNRSKSDSDLAEWRPIRSAWCVTATITAEVKAAYGLSVDPAEYDAIAEMLATCGAPDQITIGVAPVGAVPVVTAAPTTSAPPTTTQPPPAAPEGEAGDDGSVEDCVDINTASVESLDAIVHIGPSRAADIVALRPFSSVEDLTRVSGIGDARLADIVAEGLACVR